MIAGLKDALLETSVYLPIQARIRDIHQMNELTKPLPSISWEG
jgi:hypothetical protein